MAINPFGILFEEQKLVVRVVTFLITLFEPGVCLLTHQFLPDIRKNNLLLVRYLASWHMLCH